MTAPTGVIDGAVVTPYRFTDRPREVVAFLELIGLRTFLRQEDFVVLTGRAGRVAVHPRATQQAPHEHTSLVLGVPDVPLAAHALADAGLDAAWWDESWGRQASVRGPVGILTLDAEMDDPYGYDVAEPPDTAASGVDVVATIRASDLDAVTAYFGLFGFTPGSDASPEWVAMRAGARSGVVGLMPGEPGTVEIGIETTEPLDTLRDRLDAAGHPVAVAEDSGPLHLVVTDPDGNDVEVYAAT
jgi:hypothetical protein